MPQASERMIFGNRDPAICLPSQHARNVGFGQGCTARSGRHPSPPHPLPESPSDYGPVRTVSRLGVSESRNCAPRANPQCLGQVALAS